MILIVLQEVHNTYCLQKERASPSPYKQKRRAWLVKTEELYLAIGRKLIWYLIVIITQVSLLLVKLYMSTELNLLQEVRDIQTIYYL